MLNKNIFLKLNLKKIIGIVIKVSRQIIKQGIKVI